MSKKRFSFEDDPSFSGFTDEDWKEWRENTKQVADTPAAICDGCLNQVVGGGCDIYNAIEQRTIILDGECEERIT